MLLCPTKISLSLTTKELAILSKLLAILDAAKNTRIETRSFQGAQECPEKTQQHSEFIGLKQTLSTP
jgi:hypothetical protein